MSAVNQVYRDEANKPHVDEDTRGALLLKARDSLYLTVDRLANDKNDPLNLAVEDELVSLEEQIESEGDGQHFLSGEYQVTLSIHGSNGQVLLVMWNPVGLSHLLNMHLFTD